MGIMSEITGKEIFEDAKNDYDSDDLQIVDVIESETSSAMKQRRLNQIGVQQTNLNGEFIEETKKFTKKIDVSTSASSAKPTA